MKKSLLFAFVAAGSLAFGQSQGVEQSLSGMNVRAQAEMLANEVGGVAQQAPYRGGTRSAVTALGQAANVYTIIAGQRTNVSVAPELNSVVFTHRSNAGVNGDAGSGSLRYDLSTDGGATWTNNIGPTYNGGVGRYPQGGIVNDPTNTDPNNAIYHYSGPELFGGNGASWGGFLYGYCTLGGNTDTVNAVELSDPAAHMFHYIPNTAWHAGNVVHILDPEIDLVNVSDYTDTVHYRRWDFSSNPPTYNFEELYMPVYNDTGIGKAFVDAYIGFSPDGQTGYIGMIGHGGNTAVEPVGSYHLIVMKSTDGGATWGAPVNVGVSSLVDAQLANDGSNYTCAFEGDITVDSNGDMHFAVAIGGASATPWSILSGAGNFGIFDVHGDGSTFQADLIGMPQTFRGDLGGGLTEDNRPQIAVSGDGDFVMVSYFDSDTLLVGSADNTFPDAWVRGYRVQDGTWLDLVNASTGTAADASVKWGAFGDRFFKNGDDGTYSIVYAELVTGDVAAETQFYYLDGSYTFSGIGVEENDITEMRVFPNPATDNVRVAFEMKDATDVTVNVVNTVGQTVMTSLHNAVTGGNLVTLDVANLANGLYFVEVSSENGTSTQRLIVQ